MAQFEFQVECPQFAPNFGSSFCPSWWEYPHLPWRWRRAARGGFPRWRDIGCVTMAKSKSRDNWLGEIERLSKGGAGIVDPPSGERQDGRTLASRFLVSILIASFVVVSWMPSTTRWLYSRGRCCRPSPHSPLHAALLVRWGDSTNPSK